MRSPEKLFFLILLSSLLILPNLVYAQGQVRFSWAVLADTPEGTRNLDFSAPISLPSGATLQIYIDQQPGTFIYLYLHNSSDELYFLFPETPAYYNTNPPIEAKIWIPAETERFELVPPGGQEKMYLMASASRLVDLEELTAQYLARPDDQVRKAAVLQEMKKIRRRFSTLAQITETSMPVAGTVLTRGTPADRFDSISVYAIDFYSKTLRINHE